MDLEDILVLGALGFGVYYYLHHQGGGGQMTVTVPGGYPNSGEKLTTANALGLSQADAQSLLNSALMYFQGGTAEATYESAMNGDSGALASIQNAAEQFQYGHFYNKGSQTAGKIQAGASAAMVALAFL